MSTKNNSTLELLNPHHFTDVPAQTYFEAWIAAVLEVVPADRKDVCVVLANKAESAALNQQYRQKSGSTNILSFPYKHMLGDLVFCVPLVNEEAKAQAKTAQAHFAHLTVHGTLHLLGYDHVQDSDAHKMESLEINILKSLGFEDPYREKQTLLD